MEKELKNYRNNLIILFICFIILILFNLHLFFEGNIFKLLFGIILLIIGSNTFNALEMFDKNILASASIAKKIGPIMSIIMLFEGFNSINKFIINFRVCCLFFLVGGILLYQTGKKIIKYYSEN